MFCLAHKHAWESSCTYQKGDSWKVLSPVVWYLPHRWNSISSDLCQQNASQLLFTCTALAQPSPQLRRRIFYIKARLAPAVRQRFHLMGSLYEEMKCRRQSFALVVNFNGCGECLHNIQHACYTGSHGNNWLKMWGVGCIRVSAGKASMCLCVVSMETSLLWIEI